jgi:acetolactate synthase I/II/III large subunit
MFDSLSRRDLLKAVAAGALVSAIPVSVGAGPFHRVRFDKADDGIVSGHMTGAAALVETLLKEGVECVYGIPGAQDNELWDTMKTKGLPYLLVTHEFSAACMADGYARSTGKPGVLCVVPGPGVTNSLTGLGEALLDSSPVVAIVCDVARGEKYKPFQVHELPQVGLLQQVTKGVFPVKTVGEIPNAVREAMALAVSGEPGPTAVVVPYPLFIETYKFNCPPLAAPALPLAEEAFGRAVALLANKKHRVGIYAGAGCMDYSQQLVEAAELLQAPVATSVSGKGAIPESHPLAVGWGYGPQGTRTAEEVFSDVDLVLAIGVRYSEVSTGFYSDPQSPCLIQVDANADNLGKVMKTTVCVHADAGVFLSGLAEKADCLRRPKDCKLPARIAGLRREEFKKCQESAAKCGVDPMLVVLALRRCTRTDAMFFVDVTLAEHYAAEALTAVQARTYFNPTNNQAMGWSIPAAIGAQRVFPNRQTVTLTGDGCFLMTAMEISTAAREGLPVKFFVLDDQAYHYMQKLQVSAYARTTATLLAHLDYAALAKGFGVGYNEITSEADLEAGIRGSLCQDGPVLTRIATDYGKRQVRWIDAVRKRYTKELTTGQKARFVARVGVRSARLNKEND